MNTQIIQLAKQAGATTRSVCHGHGDYSTEFQLSDDSIQKFAELIVKECADIEHYWLSKQDQKVIAERIKEHFGVE